MPSSWKPPAPSASSTPCATPDRVEPGCGQVAPEAWLPLLQALPAGSHASRAVAALPFESLAQGTCSKLLELRLPRRVATRLEHPDAALLEAWRHWLSRPGRHLVTRDSPHYPEPLKALPDAPLALWVHGRALDLLQGPQVAMVGSRHPTQGGIAHAEEFAHELARLGLTVTSGLAVGIDAASHRGAVAQPGCTIAVLGSGIDHIYPRINRGLAAKILDTGLLISEYPPGTPPRKPQFPARNRVIAGLAAGTLVVEATRRSGSLITARLAADYGREVFALPGSIHNPLTRGCHVLIREGAKLVEQVDDVLVELAPQLAGRATQGQEPLPAHDRAHARLLDCMSHEPVTTTVLAARARLTPAEVSSMLLHLEIRGHVEALPGARYSRLVKRIR